MEYGQKMAVYTTVKDKKSYEKGTKDDKRESRIFG